LLKVTAEIDFAKILDKEYLQCKVEVDKNE
jgi:hypothetical protein